MTDTPTDDPAQPTPEGPAPGSGAFDHGMISAFNACFFSACTGYINHIAREHKSGAFGGLQPGTVVEIGAGTGANRSFLAPDSHLIALEPNLRMHERLRRNCQDARVDLTVLATGAEAIPLDNSSVDDIICSLTLCTVRDPARVLAEVRRVLRPGGRFRFVEHVGAPQGTPRRTVQSTIKRPWGYMFEGCDPTRDTPALIERAGFTDLQLERQKLRHSVFWPVNTAVWGVAVR